MFTYKLNCVLFLFIFQGYDCERRIQEGKPAEAQKRYVVYLIKAASVSIKDYEGWLCGGAIVSEWFIVTSAACVTDVTHLYAISGYTKYVNSDDIYKDSCTQKNKKKINLICTPKNYNFVEDKREEWSNMDIAVVKVESPYIFDDDPKYKDHCTYSPGKIEINYEQKAQEPGTDAIVLGWGHPDKYREEGVLEDYNTESLQYAPTLIIDKVDCKKSYEDYLGMDKVIDNFMICTDGTGNLDDAGETIVTSSPTAEGCDLAVDKGLKVRGENCENPNVAGEQTAVVSRKNRNPVDLTVNDASQNSSITNNKRNNSVVDANSALNSTLIKTINKTVINSRRYFRRHGICQNDHGGPLVTWVGAHEKLIGVATAFKLDEEKNCIGPYLFTSTQCSGAFLHCIITQGAPSRRHAESCTNFTRDTGLTIDERHISWQNHPDGPAENEKKLITSALPASTVSTTTNATKNIANTTEETVFPK